MPTAPAKFRPMLAETIEPDLLEKHVKFPCLVSPKLDGIRCVIRDGIAYTRRLELIPNHHIQASLRGLPPFDGELIVGAHDKDVFNRTQSAVMSEDGQPAFTYWVFDGPEVRGAGRGGTAGFHERLMWAATRANSYGPLVKAVVHQLVSQPLSILTIEKEYLAQGYEGLMIRSQDGPYKFGRSTVKEGYLFKLVRKVRCEAIVTGFVELMTNNNELEESNLGYAKRSKAKAGLVPAGTLGKLVCKFTEPDKYTDATFEIGTGFSAADRLQIWENQDKWLNAIVNMEMRGLTEYGKPRFPSFKGRRDARDMGEPDGQAA